MALEIIGPGFGRTGTNSLKVALEHLGYGPAHHMFEVRDQPVAIARLGRAVAAVRRVDWDDVFAGYRSQVDWPGARYWRELAAHYPDAKVILTVRDPGRVVRQRRGHDPAVHRGPRHASPTRIRTPLPRWPTG